MKERDKVQEQLVGRHLDALKLAWTFRIHTSSSSPTHIFITAYLPLRRTTQVPRIGAQDDELHPPRFSTRYVPSPAHLLSRELARQHPPLLQPPSCFRSVAKLKLTRLGKVRLAKWFQTLPNKQKAKIVKDVTQLVLARRTRMCNFLEYKGGFLAPLAFVVCLICVGVATNRSSSWLYGRSTDPWERVRVDWVGGSESRIGLIKQTPKSSTAAMPLYSSSAPSRQAITSSSCSRLYIATSNVWIDTLEMYVWVPRSGPLIWACGEDHSFSVFGVRCRRRHGAEVLPGRPR